MDPRVKPAGDGHEFCLIETRSLDAETTARPAEPNLVVNFSRYYRETP